MRKIVKFPSGPNLLEPAPLPYNTFGAARGADKESNWLPTPQEGAFRPIMRLYQPRHAILDGSYVLPAIARVG